MRIQPAIATALLAAAPAMAKAPAWSGYAGNAQHTAAAPAAGQSLTAIRWQTPVDDKPQYSGNELFIHYASPMITAQNTVLLPVKTGAAGNFQLEAHNGRTGALLWTLPTDYVLPSASWTPSFPAGETPSARVYIAGAGGTVLYRDAPNQATGATGRLAFYGLDIFNANQAAMTTSVQIDTPITADAHNNIYFGFVVAGANPASLQSGIARIAANGTGIWVSAAAAAQNTGMTQVAMNCAPAVSADGKTIYMTVSDGAAGELVALDSTTLATRSHAALTDPASGQAAWVADLSTASPTIGPNGDVFYGVLENPFPSHNDRGWLLHFNAGLTKQKIPGSFGWDDTVSIVPATAVPAYSGKSTYLIMTKYNNYYGVGTGDGMNRIAILDPGAAQFDEYTTGHRVKVMKEVETQLGPTPSSSGGVFEWCINSAAADARTTSVFAGSEDGRFYRWDIATNALTQKLFLNDPTPEAYTPSVVGPDGTIYAINNATLYAIGR